MTTTSQIGFALMEASQAQKHVTVNEALFLLDAVVQLNVLSATTTVPPGSTAEGDKYIVPTGATGAWSGHTDALALFMGGGWVFLLPRAGWTVWVASSASFLSWSGTAWVPFAAGAVRTVAGDPASPTNGMIWYNSTSNTLRARVNGSNVTLA